MPAAPGVEAGRAAAVAGVGCAGVRQAGEAGQAGDVVAEPDGVLRAGEPADHRAEERRAVRRLKWRIGVPTSLPVSASASAPSARICASCAVSSSASARPAGRPAAARRTPGCPGRPPGLPVARAAASVGGPSRLGAWFPEPGPRCGPPSGQRGASADQRPVHDVGAVLDAIRSGGSSGSMKWAVAFRGGMPKAPPRNPGVAYVGDQGHADLPGHQPLVAVPGLRCWQWRPGRVRKISRRLGVPVRLPGQRSRGSPSRGSAA